MLLRFVHPPCCIFWRIIGTRNLEFLSIRFLTPNNGVRNDNDSFHSEHNQEISIPSEAPKGQARNLRFLTFRFLVRKTDSE
jgi:hypothetical protein